MNCHIPSRRNFCIPTVKHHVICRHQIEVEVVPALAEVYFQDERYEDAVDTQVRFTASVYNAPTEKVSWQVLSLAGGPGAGTIDASGLYTAPLKGGHPFTVTDIIVATSVDDPMRKAYVRVTIVGRGPEPLPVPKLEVFPKTAFLYYPEGAHNNHIDKSNTMQLFRTRIHNALNPQIKWYVDNTEKQSGYQDWYLYELSGSGAQKTVRIKASITIGLNTIQDEAVVMQLNYSWPGIV
ncbi:MAG: hypothetical protein HY578_02270 [Nitrospinae bacterium]|nr:hypothetical protein [Nitrospinota bacterium]